MAIVREKYVGFYFVESAVSSNTFVWLPYECIDSGKPTYKEYRDYLWQIFSDLFLANDPKGRYKQWGAECFGLISEASFKNNSDYNWINPPENLHELKD